MKRIIRYSVLLLLFSCVSLGLSIPTNSLIEKKDRPNFVPPNPEVYEPDEYVLHNPVEAQGAVMMAMDVPERVSVDDRPSAGEVEQLLIIPLAFKDDAFDADHDIAHIEALADKLKDYYEFNSSYDPGNYGISINATVSPVVTSKETHAYFGSDISVYDVDSLYGHPGKLAQEALELLKALDFDFSSFDSDDPDKVIDHLLIFHAGSGQENSHVSSDIWSHHFHTPSYIDLGPIGDESSVQGYNYITVPEDAQLGVLAHEFGHEIGLPDLYDSNGSTNGSSNGIGEWGIMGSGSWNYLSGDAPGSTPANLSAWSKEYLGWTTPTTVNSSMATSVTNSDGDSSIVKVWAEGNSGTNEYYLIEYRRKLSGNYDEALPGEGVLIWHINNDNLIDYINLNDVNDVSTNQRVELEQADGNYDLTNNQYNRGDATDPFGIVSGEKNFNNVSVAYNDSAINADVYTFVDILNIEESGDTASFDVYVTKSAPVEKATDILPLEYTFSSQLQPEFEWEIVPLSESYVLQMSSIQDFSSDVTEIVLNSNSASLVFDGEKFQYTLTNANVLGAYDTYYWRIAGTNTQTNNDEVYSDTRVYYAYPIEFSFMGDDANKLLGSTVDMEYSIDGGSSYNDVTEIDFELDANAIASINATDDIQIRMKTPVSTDLIIDILPSVDPVVSLNDKDNIIVGIDNTMEFSMDGGSTWTAYDNNLPNLDDNITVLVRTIRSPKQLLGNSVMLSFTKTAAPDGIDFAFDGVNASKLMGVTTDMEFSVDGGTTYITVSENDLSLDATELAAINATNDILVRYSETANSYPSEAYSINILDGPTAPTIIANDKLNTLSGIDSTMEFSTDNVNWTVYSNNLPSLEGNVDIWVRIASTGKTMYSDVTLLSYSLPGAPSVSFTMSGDNANILLDSTNLMEYSIDGGVSYDLVPSNNYQLSDNELSNLTGDNDLRIRFAATNDVEAGVDKVFDIQPVPSAPNVSADDRHNTVIGLDTTMEYSINNGNTWIVYDGSAPNVHNNLTFQVRLLANGLIPRSEITSLIYTAPNAPNGISFSYSGDNANKVMGATTLMEYSIDGGSSYTAFVEDDETLATGVVETISYSNDLLVRIAETMDEEASLDNMIDILEGPSAPNVSADDNNNTIVGINSTMEFSSNGGSTWIKYNSNMIDLSGTTTILVRYAAFEQTVSGATKTLSFTVPSPPSSGGGSSSGGGGFIFIPPTTNNDDVEDEPGEVTEDGIKTIIDDTKEDEVTISFENKKGETTIEIEPSVFDELSDAKKVMKLDGKEVDMIIPSDAFRSLELSSNSKITMDVKVIGDRNDVDIKEPDTSTDGGLFSIGNTLFEFNASVISKDKTTVVTSFDKPLTITVNVNPEEVGDIDKGALGVYYYNETSLEWEYMGGSYDPLSGTITFETTHFSYYAVMEYFKSFEDIKSHWAKDYIETMASRRITNGKSETIFDPNSNTTRAEYVALVVRALKLELSEAFISLPYNDVSSSKWYYNEISVAYDNNILKAGMSFNPHVDITREDMMAIIANALAEATDVDLPTEEEAEVILSNFVDASEIKDENRQAVAYVINNGIITGRTSDTIAPKENATRAETMVVVSRLLNLLNK